MTADQRRWVSSDPATHAPNCTDPDDLHRGVCRTDRRTQSPAGVDAPGGHVAPAGTSVVGASVGAS